MPSTLAPTQRTRGFTLVECCVVVLVLVVIACTAAPSVQALIESRRLTSAAAALAADIQFVRHEAVARNRALRLSFYVGADANCYVVHTGSAGSCPCIAAGPTRCRGDGAEIKTVAWSAADRISLQANVASIVFDPLHGTSTPTSTLRVVDSRGHAVYHVINIMGRVRSCSPRAAIASYRAC